MDSMMARVVGKKKDPAEQAKEWKRSMQREVRGLERQIKSMDAEEKKVIREMKKLAMQGSRNDKAIRSLAQQLVQSRKVKERLYEGRAQLNSVQMQLQNQMAMVKVTGCIKKSTEVMASVSRLVNIPELQQSMMELAREMERAGLVEEVVSDGMALLDGAGVEEDAAREVDQVIAELTAGMLQGAEDAPTRTPEQQGEEEELEAASQDEAKAGVAEMKMRLETL